MAQKEFNFVFINRNTCEPVEILGTCLEDAENKLVLQGFDMDNWEHLPNDDDFNEGSIRTSYEQN